MSLSDNPVVLLVDDQLIIGEAVRRILAVDPGIAFHFCQRGADALATAARINPTVILQDLVMPDADGLDLVRGYRQQEATALTPLIVLSSKEEGATKAEAFARGANDYIVKLPDPVELIARIRYHSRGYISLLQRNQAFEALRVSQEALAAELAKAATYVRSILPAPMRAPVSIDWIFVPSASLGGDCFDYFWIDDDHLAIYLLDVCGHGVGPALLGVSAMNSVRSGGMAREELRDPGKVLGRLNASYQMEQHSRMYFTIWYGVYQLSSRKLSYSGGGHPSPLLYARHHASTGDDTSGVRRLESPTVPIGIAPDIDFPTVTEDIEPGSSLVMYSDGAIEVFAASGRLWGIDGLVRFMNTRDLSGPRCLQELHDLIMSMSASETLADDFSALVVRFPN